MSNVIPFRGYQLHANRQKHTVEPLALKHSRQWQLLFFINFFFLLGHKQIVGLEAFPEAEFVFLLTWAISEALVWG